MVGCAAVSRGTLRRHQCRASDVDEDARLGQFGNGSALEPSRFPAWLAIHDPGRLASTSECSPRCRYNRNPLLDLSANDGTCWFFCGELLLGIRSFADCFEPAPQRRDTTHILYSPRLLLLSPGE